MCVCLCVCVYLCVCLCLCVCERAQPRSDISMPKCLLLSSLCKPGGCRCETRCRCEQQGGGVRCLHTREKATPPKKKKKKKKKRAERECVCVCVCVFTPLPTAHRRPPRTCAANRAIRAHKKTCTDNPPPKKSPYHVHVMAEALCTSQAATQESAWHEYTDNTPAPIISSGPVTALRRPEEAASTER